MDTGKLHYLRYDEHYINVRIMDTGKMNHLCYDEHFIMYHG